MTKVYKTIYLILIVVSCSNIDINTLSKKESLPIRKLTKSDSVYVEYDVSVIKATIYNSKIIDETEKRLFSPIVCYVINDIVAPHLDIKNRDSKIILNYSSDVKTKFEISTKEIIVMDNFVDKVNSFFNASQNEVNNIEDNFSDLGIFNLFKDEFSLFDNNVYRNIYGYEKLNSSEIKLYFVIEKNSAEKFMVITYDSVLDKIIKISEDKVID